MSKPKNAGLWGGRFEEGLTDVAIELSESISFDIALYAFDIEASIAHAEMLAAQEIISTQQFEKIRSGLNQVKREIEKDELKIDYALEDIHTHIEKRLTEIIGEDGKRLHTGRSRNDQVAVDTHLYLRAACQKQQGLLRKLLNSLLEMAEKHKEQLWAGYTHTQIAQPVLLGHYLLAYFFKFERDLRLLNFVEGECDRNPLGAGAMAGANYNLNREKTSELLGFKELYHNSMDAVSNRDYQLNYLYFVARFFTHVSRLCEDLILYSTYEFGYVKMSDKVTTGSSIMPQKKNADICELLRGKSAKVIANLQALFINLKGLPLTYNRDLQEDKLYLFDSVRQCSLGIKAITEVIENCQFYSEKVEKNLDKGFAQATDVADFLVAHYQVPFREAHELTGKLVLYCEQRNTTIGSLTKEEITEAFAGKYEIDAAALSLKASVNRKQGKGATSLKEVEVQIAIARKLVQS